jgi:hypothetical protein
MRITEYDIIDQLPEGSSVMRFYRAVEGDLRVIVQEPGEPYEKRYTITEVDGKPVLRHMP